MSESPFLLLVAVQPPKGTNIRAEPWGTILGTASGQTFRAEGYRVDPEGRLWLEIWWTETQTAFVAGWLCPLVMLAPLEIP